MNFVKYLLEGLAVAVAAHFIPNMRMALTDVLYIGLTAGATFLILDLLSPSIGAGARQGSGFGIGLNQVGWQTGGNVSLPVGDNESLSESTNTSNNSVEGES